jgi:nitroreductase
MAVQNLMLSARGLGLGALMTTAHTLVNNPLREACAIPDDAFPVALIPIGYPDANFGPTKRKGLDEILRWNSWS